MHRSPKDRITQGSYILVPRPNVKGIPESRVCRTLMCLGGLLGPYQTHVKGSVEAMTNLL